MNLIDNAGGWDALRTRLQRLRAEARECWYNDDTHRGARLDQEAHRLEQFIEAYAPRSAA